MAEDDELTQTVQRMSNAACSMLLKHQKLSMVSVSPCVETEELIGVLDDRRELLYNLYCFRRWCDEKIKDPFKNSVLPFKYLPPGFDKDDLTEREARLLNSLNNTTRQPTWSLYFLDEVATFPDITTFPLMLQSPSVLEELD
jgi:hypothetical protein